MKSVSCYRPLGRILIDGEFMSDHQLDTALERTRTTNQRLGEVLVEMGVLDHGDLDCVLDLQRRFTSSDDVSTLVHTVREKLGNILLKEGCLSPNNGACRAVLPGESVFSGRSGSTGQRMIIS